MKRILCAVLAAIMLLIPAIALADSEPVVISVVTTPTPEPISAPPTPAPKPLHYQEFQWSQDDIDTMAQGYWVWCNTEAEKRDFTMLAVNRMMCDAVRDDGSRLFPDTIEGVMTQSGEFDIDTAHISDKNRVLAKENLNKCMTQWLIGNAGIDLPRSAIYAGRFDGVLMFKDAAMNVVWRCA